MNKKRLPYHTVSAFALFAALALVCGQTVYSQTSNVSFPAGFIETWKRDNFNNTLTFTAKTVKSSSSTTTWNLTAINGNAYKMNNGKTDMTLTIRLVSGNIEISGDSGQGENNWNGTWKKQTQAASPAPTQPSAQAQEAAFVAAGRGYEYLNNGDYDKAITEFNVALRNYPNNVEFLNLRGNAYSSKGDYDNAIADYTAVLRQNPEAVSILNNRGLAYAKKDDIDKAVADFKEALRIYPNYPEAINNLVTWNTSTPAPGANLTAKLVWVLRNAQTGGDYTIELTRDESFNAQTLIFEGKTNIILRFIGGESEKTITLNGNGSLFTVASGVNLVLGKGITLYGHKSNNTSLVMVNQGGMLIMNEGSRITGNNAKILGWIRNAEDVVYLGGGVYVGGTFIMNGGTINGNNIISGTGGVGGVYVKQGATFLMNGGTISENTGDYGGGVYVKQGGTFTMNGGVVSGNTVPDQSGGGGVYCGKNATFSMNGGEISGNTSYYGGGVFIEENATFSMNGGAVSSNTASSYSGGSGVYVDKNATFSMSGGKISGNTARENSGGVRVDGNFSMFGGEISGNVASVGGGVYVYNKFTMYGGKISGNKASSDNESGSAKGGGVYISELGTFTMHGGDISDNAASASLCSGGGVYVDGYEYLGTFTMNGGTISKNTANGGGGVSVSGTFTMYGGEIFGNTAYNSGGGVLVNVRNGGFVKRGGTIYGYEEGDDKSNIAKYSSGVVKNNRGHAVFADESRRRESTTGPDDNPDMNKTGLAGGWGY